MIEPVSHEQRTAAVEHLAALLTADVIDLDSFETATSKVLATTTVDELTLVLSYLPSPVRRTQPGRELTHPLEIDARSTSVRLTGPWQLASETKVTCRSGSVVLDLTVAEFDAELIDLDLDTQSGSIIVIVPHGVNVQLADVSGSSGSLRNKLGQITGLPGAPCIRIRARTKSGSIVLRSPRSPGRFRRWFRRR